LVLTTMHRSLIGVDKFLGQAMVALDEVFGAGRAQHTQIRKPVHRADNLLWVTQVVNWGDATPRPMGPGWGGKQLRPRGSLALAPAPTPDLADGEVCFGRRERHGSLASVRGKLTKRQTFGAYSSGRDEDCLRWFNSYNCQICKRVTPSMNLSVLNETQSRFGQGDLALKELKGQAQSGRWVAKAGAWYKLHSKAGKKEKERGEIQVTIQFTRNNLSASMFDLSVKDKPRSPFRKIKDKMKGKKKFDLESASAILPSSALEDPELGSLSKMGKAKGFFLRNKLRKSSLTQSNTSLGSDSTLSSASGSLACQGPGAELLTRSPSRSSWLDEASQVRAAPPRALLDLQGHLDGTSRSSLCVNGSHIYSEEPQGPLRHRSSISGPFPPAGPLHTVSSRPSEEGPRSADESWGRSSRRTGSSEAVPGQEELSPQVLAVGARCSGEEEGAWPSEGRPVQVATPMVASSEPVAEKEGARKEERKPRMGLFHHHHQGLSRSEMGRRGSLGEKGVPTLGASPHHSSSGEEKAKSSWFGLRETKEPTQKPSASRASPTPLASSGKALPEWDDTFNIFAASRLRPEARSEILAPAGVGLEATGQQDPGPGAVTMKAAEPQGDPGGGERGGSSVWLEPRVPLDLGLDHQSTSVVDPGPLGAEGACLPSASARPHPRASDSEADRELPAPGGEAGQSLADSATSLFSSPEVISVWERLPGPDSAPEGQDEEASQGGSQLFHELNTVDDSWPWDVVTVSPAAEASSPVLWGESDEPPTPQMQPESPEPVSPKRHSQEKEAAMEEEKEKAAGGLSSRGSEMGGEDVFPSALTAGPPEAEEDEGEKPESESDSRSGATLGGPGLEDLAEDASPPVSGPCLPRPTSCPQDPAPTPSKTLALQSQQIWGAPEREEGPEAPEAQSQEPVGEACGFLSGSSQQADLWVSEEDALNPFLPQGSQGPPSLPSTSLPGSRDPSVHCAWPLTSCSPPPGEPASPTGSSPPPLGEDHAAVTPASPLALLPLETRPAEEPQPSASPHPVKPLSAAPVEGSPDRKQPRSSLSTALSSGLERLKTVTSGSIQPVAPAPQVGQTVDAKRLKRERELSQRDEHVQELESYIDRLLVRIMETSPTLLQIPPAPPK
ncbi:hypothetical protein E2I00_016105, partial [Balaenoptera physalus]